MSQIRLMKKEELFEGAMASIMCFHGRVDDLEKVREKAESSIMPQWGYFLDDGTLAGRIFFNEFSFLLDGQAIPSLGIGGVVTLPEYRNTGAIRNIFEEVLPKYYDSKVISTLAPFQHEFYRKFGYEVLISQHEYEFAPAILENYKFSGQVKRYIQGTSVKEFLNLYNEFTSHYNLGMFRDEERMLRHMSVEKEYMDRRFSYMFSINGKNIGYLIMKDIKNDPKAILKVEECAWLNRDGFQAILGFLARFSADYGTIQLALPYGIDLTKLVKSKRSFEIKKYDNDHFMIRVINAKRLLELIQKPKDCDFTIQVQDEVIPQNNVIYHVTKDLVTEVQTDSPDIALNVRALGQLAVGHICLEEAVLRPDVEVNGNEDQLQRVFIGKKIFYSDHF